MPRKAPKCSKCQQHPRSQIHREKCGIQSKKAVDGARSVAVQKKAVSKIRRGRQVDTTPVGPISGWVLGTTCLTCQTHYREWEPEFQDEDAKHGKYDVTKQLPHTSHNYPICPRCLPGHWKSEARRLGVERQVLKAYG